MADTFKREDIEKVAQHLESYANAVQRDVLENLAKVAIFQEKAAQERVKVAVTPGPGSLTEQLHNSLAASVGLGKV